MPHPADAEQLLADLSTLSMLAADLHNRVRIRGLVTGLDDRRSITLCVGLVLACLAGSTSAADQSKKLLLADGRQAEGQLLSIDESWQLRFHTAQGEQAFSAQELIAWGVFPGRDRGESVLLTDGSRVMGELTAASRETISVEARFGPVEFQRHRVAGILSRLAVNDVERDRFIFDLTERVRDHDRLWLVSGDELAGVLTGVRLPSADDPDIYDVEFDFQPRESDRSIAAPIENTIAIGFRTDVNKLAKPTGPSAMLALRDGTVLAVSQVTTEDANVRLRLLNDEILTARADAFWKLVSGVQVFGEHVTYLSDVEPLGYKHIPFLSTSWNFGRDRNALGGKLRFGNRLFPKGIGMHSTSRLAYELKKPFRRFDAEIAIDGSAGQRGSVTFRVFVETANASAGDSQWRVAYESPVVRGGDSPLPISVDLTGVARMALVVDFADRGDQGDRANWLNARLTP